MTRQDVIQKMGLKSRAVYARMERKCLTFEEALLYDTRGKLSKLADNAGMTKKQFVEEGLKRHGGVYSRLARELGVDNKRLYEALQNPEVPLERIRVANPQE